MANATWLQKDVTDWLQFDACDRAFVILNFDPGGRGAQDAVGAAQSNGFDRPATRKRTSSVVRDPPPARHGRGLPEHTGARLASYADPAREAPGTPGSLEPKGEGCRSSEGASLG
ncbi:hypothetical protein ACIQB5_50775 [Streptomyces sp. NPDC088560]|uniref:hypothetical protein n=1 Tax=Streptomyces sp. NPDC088560 TaxID=3365868 RepID=UPI0037FE614D